MLLDDRYGAFIKPELNVDPLGNGILDGLTFAVKDVFAVAGHRSSAGNPDWLRSHDRATGHAAAVGQLLLSGATLRGAAHTDELMYSLGGENHHYGTPMNPRAKGRIPGGSSSGSAVAVAAGIVDFALGTDTGGSIRVPSSYCGVYGFRPTHGAVNMQGVIPLSPSFDTVGWMANCVEVLQKVGEVLLEARSTAEGIIKDTDNERNKEMGKDVSMGRGKGIEEVNKEIDKEIGKEIDKEIDEGVDKCKGNDGVDQIKVKKMKTLFVAADCWAFLDPEDARVLAKGLSSLSVGAEQTVEAEIASEGLKLWMDVFRELQGSEIWATHGTWITKEKPTFGPDIAARFRWAASLAGKDHTLALVKREEISTRLRLLLAVDHCLVIPTAPGPAPQRGGSQQQLEMNRSGAMMLSCIAGLAGLPQVTLPMLSKSGLPLGLSVIGGHGQDLRLLSWVKEMWSEQLA